MGNPRRRVDPDLDLEAAHGVDVGFLSFVVGVLDREAQPIESGQRLRAEDVACGSKGETGERKGKEDE